MAIAQNFIHSWEIDGNKLSASISPCCWMNDGYGLQIRIDFQAEHGGSAYLHNKKLKFSEATEQDMIDMCNQVKLVPCKTCGKPAFDPSVVDTNRDGECEACFMAALTKEYEASRKKEAAALARRDRNRAKQGYTHRVTAWVHPSKGGDDYMVDIYSLGKPSKALITSELRKMGSRVLDDYTIVELSKPEK